MYKFSNGVVIFDKSTADEYIKAGYKLIEQQITVDEAIKEKTNEDNISNGISYIEHKKYNKKTSKHKK